MTQEEKSLLLKDLCARLPYGVKCLTEDSIVGILSGKANETSWVILTKENKYEAVKNIKPYLRPMSSMTEEERKDFYHNRTFHDGRMWESEGFDVDWLNKNHFDYRGLIPMNLALEAPKDMYNIKKNNYGNN